jgi:hypothetical protein
MITDYVRANLNLIVIDSKSKDDKSKEADTRVAMKSSDVTKSINEIAEEKNIKLLFAGTILVIIVALESQETILITAGNNAHAEWIIPSQLSEAYKNTYNSTAVRGQNNQEITTENSSSEGK